MMMSVPNEVLKLLDEYHIEVVKLWSEAQSLPEGIITMREMNDYMEKSLDVKKKMLFRAGQLFGKTVSEGLNEETKLPEISYETRSVSVDRGGIVSEDLEPDVRPYTRSLGLKE